MSTSLSERYLSEREVSVRIPATDLEYMRVRNRLHIFNLIHDEFRRSGISQADLARRMGRGTDRVCRLLGAPGNWTLDTVSDLLFAISAAEVNYQSAYPLSNAPRNQIGPDWLSSKGDKKTDPEPLKGFQTEIPPPKPITTRLVEKSFQQKPIMEGAAL